MDPGDRTWIWVLLVVLALLVPSRTSLGQPVPRATTDPDSVFTSLEFFARIEGFWHNGLADSLVAFLAPDPIHLSFRKIGPRDGTFDPTQAAYLLTDLFAFARTDSFHFTRFEHDPSEDDPPVAVGHWFYRGTDGADREARVTIQLIALPEGWAILSIEAKRW